MQTDSYKKLIHGSFIEKDILDVDFSDFLRMSIVISLKLEKRLDWIGYALGSDKQVIGIIKQKKENGKIKLLMKFTLILNIATCLFTKV